MCGMACRYGHEHVAQDLQKEAVYGLTELNRAAVKSARLLANPGCYPTCSQLPLYPLVKAKLILTDDIIIDAKSGQAGADLESAGGEQYSECVLIIIVIIMMIIKGHSLRKACLQPATNTQNSKPRPPTTNAKSKGKPQNKIKPCSKLSTG